MLDGELAVWAIDRMDFDALQQRMVKDRSDRMVAARRRRSSPR
ncbi:hypothetical protein [Kribbella sancticallisti]